MKRPGENEGKENSDIHKITFTICGKSFIARPYQLSVVKVFELDSKTSHTAFIIHKLITAVFCQTPTPTVNQTDPLKIKQCQG